MADNKPTRRRLVKGAPSTSTRRGTKRGTAQANWPGRTEMAERRQLDAVLREAQVTIELAMEGISKLDEAGRYVFVNPQYASLLGYRPDELIGQSWETTVAPDERARVVEMFEQMRTTGRGEGEICEVKKDGSLVYKHVLIVKPDTPHGKMSGHYCFVRDITERKRTAAALAESQRLLTAIARVQSLFIDDQEPKAVWGTLLEELLRLTASEYGFIGEIIRSDEDQPVLRCHAITNIAWNEESRAMMARSSPNLEFRNLKTLFGHVMTTGKPVIANDPANDPRAGGLPPGYPPMHAFLGLPFYHHGQLTGMVGIANRPGGYDEQLVAYLQPFLGTCAQLLESYRSRRLKEEAEAARRLSEERWHLAVKGTNDGIWDWDLRTNEVYFSERWKSMIGYEEHELLNTYSEWESRLHPDDQTRVLSGLTAYLESRQNVYDVEFRLRKKDGSYCWIQARGKAAWDTDGRPYRMTGSHTDITDRKREEALQTAEKLTLELVAKGTSLRDVLMFLCQAIEQHTVPMLSSVMLVTEGGSHLSAVAGPSLSDEYSRMIGRLPIGPEVGSCGSAAYFRQPVIVCDIATDPLWKDYAHVALAHGLQACWSQPIMSSTGHLLGTFAAYFRERRVPCEPDLKLVKRASYIAALAIEHARTLEALRESEERFRLILMNEPECVKTVASDGKLLGMNPAGLRMIEASSLEEVVGRSVLPMIHPDDRSAFWEAHCTVANGSTRTLEFRVVGLKGQLRWMDTHSVPLHDAEGMITAVLSVTRDITERKRVERASQDQTDRLRLAMDIAGLATWDWNILTNQVVWSENCEQVKRLPAGSFDGTFEFYQRLVHPEDLPRLQADIECALSGQKPYHTEHRIVPPTGDIQWIEGNGVVYRDELGRPVRMVGTVRNITEQKRSEQSLRVNEERYARATAVGQVGVWELDVRTGTYYGDKNLKAMFGYQDDELSADPYAWLNVVYPGDRSIAMAHWQRVVKGEADDYEYELRMVRKDGTIIWTDVRGHAVRDSAGGLTYLIGATVDITHRKAMETTLAEQAECLKLFFEHSPLSMAMLDREMRYLAVSHRFRVEYRLGDQPLIGRSHYDVFPEIPERWKAIHRRCLAGAVERSEEDPFIRVDGHTDWIRWEIRPWMTATGEIGGIILFSEDITARKQVEAARETLQYAVDQGMEGIALLDSEGRYTYVNEAHARISGFTASELLGRSWRTLYDPDQIGGIETSVLTAMQTEQRWSGELTGRTKTGAVVYVEVGLQLLPQRGAVPQGFLCTCRDITTRKKAEESLQRTQFAMDQAVDAVYWIDAEAKILYTNEAASAMLGYTADEFLTMTVHDLNPDFPSEVWPGWWKETREKKVMSLETVHVRKDGRRIPIDIHVTFLAYEGEEFHCAFVRDISERKRADEVLRASQERFALAVRATNDGIWDWDLSTGVQHWSDRHFELFGFAPGDFTPTYDLWISLLHPDDAVLVHQATQHHLDTREPYDVEARVRMKDGSYRWFRDRGQAVWDSTGRLVRMVGSTSDITERREAEESLRNAHAELEHRVAERTEQLALTNASLQEEIAERIRAEETIRESEVRYKLLTDSTFDGIAIHDQGTLIEVNAGLERMFGYEPGELIGRPIWDLIAEEYRDLVVANMRSGATGPYEALGLRKDGTTFPGEVVVRPYWYRGKEVRLVAGRDITERKHLEVARRRHTQELERQVIERTKEISELMELRARAEKLAAVGQLAAGVAHEINNPIAGIKNAFQLVKQAVDPAHPQYEFVEMIDREITRVAGIVQKMYLLYKKQEIRTVDPADLPIMFRDLQELLEKPLAQRKLSITITIRPSVIARLYVPQGDLFQVLLNLAQNAIDSSQPGGTISFVVEESLAGVCIAVSDTGTGIAPDVLPHIFDPFFTTKTESNQKGMGLGLAVSQSLVTAMGGKIEVQTCLGHGSTFSILLPRQTSVMPTQLAMNKEVFTHDD